MHALYDTVKYYLCFYLTVKDYDPKHLTMMTQILVSSFVVWDGGTFLIGLMYAVGVTGFTSVLSLHLEIFWIRNYINIQTNLCSNVKPVRKV